MKGIEQFQQTLKISPKNASAHYGLASSLLGLSKECVNLGAFRWGASLLEVSVSNIQSSISSLIIQMMIKLAEIKRKRNAGSI